MCMLISMTITAVFLIIIFERPDQCPKERDAVSPHNVYSIELLIDCKTFSDLFRPHSHIGVLAKYLTIQINNYI